ADERTEDAHRGDGADRRDPIDRAHRRLRRLQARDDLPVRDPRFGDRALRAQSRAVLDGLEVALEAVLTVLAGTRFPERLLVEDRAAEGPAVETHGAQRVVAPEIVVRRGLKPDEQAGFLLHPPDERLEDVEIRLVRVVTGVEVDVGDPRLAPRRPDHLHDL